MTSVLSLYKLAIAAAFTMEDCAAAAVARNLARPSDWIYTAMR